VKKGNLFYNTVVWAHGMVFLCGVFPILIADQVTYLTIPFLDF